jgi:hypothetical protein
MLMHDSCDNADAMVCMFIRAPLRHGELVLCSDPSIRSENAMHTYAFTDLHVNTTTAGIP